MAASWASTPAARNVMRANRKRDTGPELRLRRSLHGLGLRYRLYRRIDGHPPVAPDVVFPRAKVAVFVDGCFWHACEEHGVQPRTNSRYWKAKLQINRERDRRVDQSLIAAGWLSLRVWEHESSAEAALRIQAIVSARRQAMHVQP